MKKILLLLSLFAFSAIAKPTGTYKIVVEGFDWGAGVNKVILALNDTTSKANAADYTVYASRKLSTGPIADQDTKREIVTAYVSDENGAHCGIVCAISIAIHFCGEYHFNFTGIGAFVSGPKKDF